MRPVAIGACAATKLAMCAARSRSVPCSGEQAAPTPKRASAHRVQRGSDAQRFEDAAPTVLAVLVRARTFDAVARSLPHSASAHAIADSV